MITNFELINENFDSVEREFLVAVMTKFAETRVPVIKNQVSFYLC